MKRRALLALTLGASLCRAAQARPPALLLAEVYREGLPLADYWVSEKFDGIRAYWDGTRLWSRGGIPIEAPQWFVRPLPAQPLDGELWAGRGRFEDTVSAVRSQAPDDAAWRQVRFMVFDLPAHGGTFDQRLAALKTPLPMPGADWIVPVAQHRVASHTELKARMRQVVQAGGEGLMLHRGGSFYRAERSTDLLKLKPFEDAEARVVGHLPGKGRHAGRLGALRVETPQGQRFNLGSGFTDAQRDHPPPIGAWVSYRFNGRHDSGLPRFARFLRVRADWPR